MGIFEIYRFLELGTRKGTNLTVGEFQNHRKSSFWHGFHYSMPFRYQQLEMKIQALLRGS